MALRARFSVAFLGFLFLFSSLGWSFEIRGKISVPPPYPEAQKIHVKKKVKDACSEDQISSELQVDSNGGVANVVVWLEGNFENKEVTAEKPVLNQNRCGYSPHVFLVPKDSSFTVTNSDPLAHDIRAFHGAEMVFRFEMDPGAKPIEENFSKPGIYPIRCGLHPWMYAFAVKQAHPFYAVTQPDGGFSIQNVPAGAQKVHLWHETLGEASVPVEVKDGMSDFSYVFKKA